MKSYEEIRDAAIAGNWTNSRAKTELKKAGLSEKMSDLVSELRKRLGRKIGPSVANGEESKNLETDKNIREAQKRDQQEAEEEKRKTEVAEIDGVEPHWPTYHEAMRLGWGWKECCDARRHGDVGDVRFLGDRLTGLVYLADLACVPEDHSARKIMREHRDPTEKQIKLISLVIAKFATATGLTGRGPLSAATSHKQCSIEREDPEILLDLPEDSMQRVSVRFVAKKSSTERPYLAKLGGDNGTVTREFAKSTGKNHKYFTLSHLQIGSVIESRGFIWSDDDRAFVGGVSHAVVAPGVLIHISRDQAMSLARKETKTIQMEESARCIRLSPDAKIPESFIGGSCYSAWIEDENGNTISVFGEENTSEVDDDDE